MNKKDFLLITDVFAGVSLEHSPQTNNLNFSYSSSFRFLYTAARDENTERYSSCQSTFPGGNLIKLLRV